jgi:hypothetical protein
MAAADDLARIIQAWAYNIEPEDESFFSPRAF